MSASRWPHEPYKGLAYYGPRDQLLFTGRQIDVDSCTALLAEPKTRVLLIHGRTGCGKSSLLRAGLVPALEAEGFAFAFLRRPSDGDPIFIRCTADPISRIAEELFYFSAEIQSIHTALGVQKVDLSDVRAGKNILSEFVVACRNPFFLLGILKAIATKLVHTVVLVLDQGEEVITLSAPESDDSQIFFQFVKLLNSMPCNVKLVVALRTENFGEFFDNLHFDASAITDVKQFSVSRLDRQQVKYAIEFPTSRIPVSGQSAPYDFYQFEYEPGLVDRIVDDLFAADPSGGILPVMQIVCRDLYNETRRPGQAFTITKDRYEAGAQVSGRVDKHISRSIRSALHEENAAPDRTDEYEERWRSGLASLARYEADGTVRTDVISEASLKSILLNQGVDAQSLDYVLHLLTSPDRLILREFTVVNPTSGVETKAYSLGHDSIALVLHQWSVKREATNRVRQSELEARRKLQKVVAISAVSASLLVGLFVGVLAIVNRSNLLGEITVSRAFAQSLMTAQPRIALTAAITAAREYQAIWWGQPTSSPQIELAQILSRFPERVVRPSSGHKVGPGAKGFAFPQSQKFMFWDGVGAVQFDSWKDRGQSKVTRDLSGVLGGKWAGVTPINATEVAPDVFLLLFTKQRDSLVVALDGQKEPRSFTLDYFLNQSEHFNPSTQPIEFSESPLRLGTGGVYLLTYKAQNAQMIMEALAFVPSDGEEAPAFTSRGWITRDADDQIRRVTTYFSPGIALLRLLNASDSDPTMNNMIAYDIQREDFHNKEMWSLVTWQNTSASVCVKGPISTPCAISGFGRMDFVLVKVPGKVANIDPDVSSKKTTRGKLVAIHMPTGTHVDIDIDKLSAEAQEFDIHSAVAAGENARAFVLGIQTERGLDVYDVLGGIPSKIADYVTLSRGQLYGAQDGSTIVSVTGELAEVWPATVARRDDRNNALKSMQIDALISYACDNQFPIHIGNARPVSPEPVDTPLSHPCSK